MSAIFYFGTMLRKTLSCQGIPFNILVDLRKIIGRNLRGSDLDNKLCEYWGELSDFSQYFWPLLLLLFLLRPLITSLSSVQLFIISALPQRLETRVASVFFEFAADLNTSNSQTYSLFNSHLSLLSVYRSLFEYCFCFEHQ
jgi:hypothetical protein